MLSNEEMNDIMKIVQALEDSNIFLKQIIKTIDKTTKRRIFSNIIGYFTS